MPKETPKQIWLPKSELNVRVQGHNVEVYEHMVMELEPVSRRVGFDTEHRESVEETFSSAMEYGLI